MEGSRGGARGGQDQFKWDDVQNMQYKDREQYLGFSTQLGYLDKGGKWRKKDWWISSKEKAGDLKEERLKAKRIDDLVMKYKLGESHPMFEGVENVN